METPKNFATFVKKNSQTFIIERSLKDVLNMRNDRCPGTKCQKENNSCMQAVLILSGNDIEEGIKFVSPNDNAIPLVFNKRKVHMKRLANFH
jgi:hypothetical protein